MSNGSGYIKGTLKIETIDNNGYSVLYPEFVEDEDLPFSRVAELPHQCDGWRIGGEKEIKDLIEDLQECLKQLQAGE